MPCKKSAGTSLLLGKLCTVWSPLKALTSSLALTMHPQTVGLRRSVELLPCFVQEAKETSPEKEVRIDLQARRGAPQNSEVLWERSCPGSFCWHQSWVHGDEWVYIYIFAILYFTCLYLDQNVSKVFFVCSSQSRKADCVSLNFFIWTCSQSKYWIWSNHHIV